MSRQEISHPMITQVIQEKEKQGQNTTQKQEEKPVFEMSVWDFGGQEEYYNNHHHFLSVRTVFLDGLGYHWMRYFLS